MLNYFKCLETLKKKKIAKHGMDAFRWKSFRLYQIIQMTPMIDFFFYSYAWLKLKYGKV